MADVKGQVDWRDIAEGYKIDCDSKGYVAEALRTTFEPLVKAAEDAATDEQTRTRIMFALRAALDRLPKVGG